MTNEELIAKIKAEIERRKEQAKKHYDNAYSIGRCDAFSEMLNFIYGLEESEKPVPNDLKEAAETYGVENFKPIGSSKKMSDEIDNLREAFIAGAKWYAEHAPLPDESDILRVGIKEGKRLMMEEAVEGEVSAVILHENGDEVHYAVAYPEGERPHSITDKVRMIIIKED